MTPIDLDRFTAQQYDHEPEQSGGARVEGDDQQLRDKAQEQEEGDTGGEQEHHHQPHNKSTMK